MSLIINGFEPSVAFSREPKSTICAIECPENFISSEIETRLIASFKKRTHVFDSFIPEKILIALQQRDLFSGNDTDCIVVHGAESIKSKADIHHLEVILQQSSHFLLIGTLLSEGVKKLLENQGVYLLKIEPLKPWQKEQVVEKWITERLHDKKIIFESQLPKKMAEVLGADRELILSEIEKIDIWRNENETCKWGDIHPLIGLNANSTLSQLTQALLSGNLKLIIQQRFDLETQGVHELAICKYLQSVLLRKMKEEPSKKYVEGLKLLEARTCALRGGEEDSAPHQEMFLLRLSKTIS